MGTNPMRFRVEHNKGKTSYWYTLVAGNGNTVMTSKSTYADYDNALRAARRQAEALQSTDLVVEFEHGGERSEEWYPAAGSEAPAQAAGKKYSRKSFKIRVPVPSKAVADSYLNPNA